MNKELLEKYCNDTCTEKELSSVLEWFEGSGRTPEGKALLFRIWEEFPDGENTLQMNFDFILDKIHHKVNLAQSKELIEEAGQNLIKYKRRKHFISILSKAAAMLLLPALSFGLFMSFKYQSVIHSQDSLNQAYTEIFSSVDAITKISLPDGSNVWLNHSSRLSYPTKFQNDLRIVELTGEGYFEVAHNPQIPFIVRAGGIEVKALGTAFNIMAYPEEDRVETSLINGQVELLRKESHGKVISILKMEPKDLAIFHKSNSEISSRIIPDDRYFSWKDGKLVFNKEPISTVIKELNRWFNVDIQVKDAKLFDLTYTGTFVNESLPQVLELLALVSPINYSIIDREKISDGTYTKRKIILSFRRK